MLKYFYDLDNKKMVNMMLDQNATHVILIL